MNTELLLNKLDMESAADMIYPECFAGIMEMDEEIPEDVFFQMFSELSINDMPELVDSYFSEIISGVADDCVDFFSFISSYRRSMKGMINYYKDEENFYPVIAALFSFREWYLTEEKVFCRNMDDESEFMTSVFDALVLGRMEKLSEGRYAFDFSQALDLEYDDYDDYVPDEAEYYDDYGELEGEDPDVTLVDRNNPVIDGEFSDGTDENDLLDKDWGYLQ